VCSDEAVGRRGYAGGVAGSLEIGAGGGGDFDLFAASLRASSGDLETFVEVLAHKLERALPGRVVVERRAVRRFAKEKRVARIELSLGDNRYIAVAQAGSLETRCAKAVRGVVLKSEVLPLDAWLQALGAELAVEAEANEQSRLALEQLLGG
jgi:hypothetical protein